MPPRHNEPEIAVYFTLGQSIRTWAENGILERELSLYRRLENEGFRFTFVTHADTSDLDFAAKLFPIRILPLYKKLPPSGAQTLRHALIAGFKTRHLLANASLMKANQMYGSLVPALVSHLLKKPFFLRLGYEYHKLLVAEKGPLWHRTYSYCCSTLSYRSADVCLFSAKVGARYAQETFGVTPAKTFIQHNFIDTELFCPSSKKDHYHKKRVLFIGRLSWIKNIETIIKACAKARCGLDCVGKGPLASSLTALARSLGVDFRILPTRPNAELAPLIREYPVFCLASFDEGNPKALMEAMSCGSACVGLDAPGINELISHEERGLLCKSVDDFASAFLRLFADSTLRERLGAHARAYIHSFCTLDALVETELFLYSRLLSSSNLNKKVLQ